MKARKDSCHRGGSPRDDCGVKNGVAISLESWYFPSTPDPAQVCQGHTSCCFNLPRHEDEHNGRTDIWRCLCVAATGIALDASGVMQLQGLLCSWGRVTPPDSRLDSLPSLACSRGGLLCSCCLCAKRALCCRKGVLMARPMSPRKPDTHAGSGACRGTPGSSCPALLPALLCETAGGCAAAHMWPGLMRAAPSLLTRAAPTETGRSLGAACSALPWPCCAVTCTGCTASSAV